MQNKELGSGRRQLKGFKIGEMRGSFDRHFFFGYYDSLEEQGCAPGNYYLMKEAGVCGFIFFKVQSSRPSRCLELSMR